eukprot:10897869-Ditylum_brightwellii.AAC.1
MVGPIYVKEGQWDRWTFIGLRLIPLLALQTESVVKEMGLHGGQPKQLVEKQEPRLDNVTLGDKKAGRKLVGQCLGRFEGSCSKLKGYDFDVADLKASDSTELKRAIMKLEKIEIEKPMEIDDAASALDKAIFAKEVKEHVRNKMLLKDVTKQAYALLWGQLQGQHTRSYKHKRILQTWEQTRMQLGC